MIKINKNLFLLLLLSFSLQAETLFKSAGIAIEGFDAVSYHTIKKAVRGDAQYSYSWNDGTWLFSSQENLNLFSKNPKKYAPEYGGYCAYAAAQGALAPVDPTVWTIHNNKLYLNFSRGVGNRWNEDKKNYIKNADTHWKTLKLD